MAVTYAAVTTVPYQDVVTLSASAGNMTKVTLPSGIPLKVSFYPRSTAAKLVFGDDGSPADDGAIGSLDYATLPAASWTEVRFARPGGSPRTVLYLASATSAQVIEIMLERSDA